MGGQPLNSNVRPNEEDLQMRKTIITTLIPGCLFLLVNSWGTPALTRQNRQNRIPPNSIPVAAPDRMVGQAEVYYFPRSDETSVDVLNLTIWGKGEDRIDLHMSYLTRGRKPRLPDAIQVDIASIAKSHRFKGSSKVEFIVDGTKWKAISVEPQILDEPNSVIEDYVFSLSLEQFRQIGKASSVVVKAGSAEVKLSEKHRQAFLDMLRAAE